MAKKSIIAREKKRRKVVEQYASRRAQLIADGDYEGLQKLPRNASPVRLHNRCALTGRPRGYIRRFGLCRNVFREMAHDGKIPGMRKSSW